MGSQFKPLGAGDIIHGYAQGVFGRDHYVCTKIETVGPDWIVARDAEGDLSFASGKTSLRRLIEVRDTEQCPSGADCPVVSRYTNLTNYTR